MDPSLRAGEIPCVQVAVMRESLPATRGRVDLMRAQGGRPRIKERSQLIGED